MKVLLVPNYSREVAVSGAHKLEEWLFEQGCDVQWAHDKNLFPWLLYADTELLGVEPPMFIEVEITETDPGFKGDTVQGGTKPATIETGATLQVPMYLNQGERIKVDTRDGKFVSRV